MKKVLFLIDNLGGGGAEKVLVTFANRLSEKYDITVMTIYDEGIYKESLSDKIKYRFIFKCCNIWLKRIVWRAVRIMSPSLLYKLAIKESYDCEIAFLEGMTTKIISGGTSEKTRIAWLHTDLVANPISLSSYISQSDMENAYKKFNTVVCVSEDVKNALLKKAPELNNTVIIYNPVDKDEILKNSLIADNTHLEKRCFTFCSVGRLVREKGFDRLLDAAKMLKADGYDFDLWIFGEGALRKQLEAQAESNGIKDRVFFPGFLKKALFWLKQSDTYICSSYAEGYGLSVTEALILGIPVVSTPCTGPVELLGNGEYGIITEDTTKGIYNGMKKLIDSDSDREYYSRKALERSKFFNIENVIAQAEDIIERESI